MHKLILVFSAMIALVAMPAYASTISISPTTVNVTKGESLIVTLNVDPAGAKVYTVKTAVSFPAALLQETAFSFASGWMPLSMAGYDSLDNTAGTLIKTAGFPGGFTTVKAFGTITFKAQDSGTATISITSASLAYDAQSKNTLSGTQGSSVVSISALASAPAPVPVPQPAPQISTSPAPKPTIASSIKRAAVTGHVAANAKAATTSVKSAVASTSMQVQTAAAGAGFFGGYRWLAALAALILIAGGAWWYARRR